MQLYSTVAKCMANLLALVKKKTQLNQDIGMLITLIFN